LHRSKKALGEQAQELPGLIMSKLNLCTRLNIVLAHQSLTRRLMFCKLRPALFLQPGLDYLLLQHKSENSAAATAKLSTEKARGSSVQAGSQNHSPSQPQQQSPLA